MIGMGKYRFKSSYRSLELSCSQWFTMTTQQKEKHLIKVSEESCVPTESSLCGEEMSHSSAVKDLTISPQESGITNLSSEQLEWIWEKAKKILNTEGSICNAPGMCVASETNNRPHFCFKNKKKEGIACDDACLAWKAQRLCSHTLAVAEYLNNLEDFLTWYRNLKASGNYTAVAMHSQSKNVGKKSATKRKGAAVKRPEIETYINPFQITEISHHDYGTPTQSHTPASASLQNSYFITENFYLVVLLRMNPCAMHHILRHVKVNYLYALKIQLFKALRWQGTVFV